MPYLKSLCLLGNEYIILDYCLETLLFYLLFNHLEWILYIVWSRCQDSFFPHMVIQLKQKLLQKLL